MGAVSPMIRRRGACSNRWRSGSEAGKWAGGEARCENRRMSRARLAVGALLLLAGCAERASEAAPAPAASGSAATSAVAYPVIDAGSPAKPAPAGPMRVLVAGDLLPHRPALA